MAERRWRRQIVDWGLVLLVAQVRLIESFSVTTKTPTVTVNDGDGADLYCDYTADFGQPRVEWKFKNLEGSLVLVYYSDEITANYVGRVDYSPRALHFSKTLASDSGDYSCEVTATDGAHTGTARINLIVQVPPGIPQLMVPTSVTTGSSVELRCWESGGYPRPTYKWYRDKVLVPVSPKGSPTFRNSTYTLDPKTGILNFKPVAKSDSGEYSCEASNGVGNPVMSALAIHMDVYDTNVGGIVAGVIIALLVLAFIGIGLWFAYRKGYIGRKAESNKPKVIYSLPVVTETDDGDFKQKSSFVV